ncbi:DUF4328 domain-containing protein [Mycobacterium deserti]|uniref:DUF4328 domain-containing protein n=1 Tax=Mycobacterium deserti TaxID=2978347 RepID=A0ABT2MGY5_9MYCO|nr:DUF4328 domain-containing protein [Mycobacterium deserti]MCT7661553.1 DUF4328 domain-containing protein [Mycobacterium deserti]
MIQVCSACGTRWNVRDRRRAWCPRCNGTLLAPSTPDTGGDWTGGTAPSQTQQANPTTERGLGTPPSARLLPPGYRWIAVRPGAPPPRRGTPRPLGPTPRYSVIPRWGLIDHFDTVGQQREVPRSGPSPAMVRTTLIATMAILGAAALIHLVRYGLLILNRTVLLNPWVAGAATWLGIAVSVVAVFMVVASAVVLTNWLIARRAAAFAYRGHEDSRPVWVLRWGSLVPLVNLLWAPTFVIELAGVEDRLSWLRRPITVWWLLWVLSTVVSIFAFATSFATDAQGIADNTVTTIIAYLLALAALLLTLRVFRGFERQPVERRTKRWVMVPVDADGNAHSRTEATPDTAAVESEGQNPAA